ncbi:unnamed protein product [Calypogeia fissa]
MDYLGVNTGSSIFREGPFSNSVDSQFFSSTPVEDVAGSQSYIPDSRPQGLEMVSAAANSGGGQRTATHARPAPATSRPTPAQSPTATVSDIRKLTRSDLGKIVDWLEVDDNFAMLHGTRDNLRKRFNRYYAKYKEALALKNDSGAGLSIREMRAGISMDDKLDRLCPHFARLDVLYGERHNVDQPALSSVGIPGVPEVYREALSDDDSPIEHQSGPEMNELGDNTQADSTTQVDDEHLEVPQAQPEFTGQNIENTGTPGIVEDEAAVTNAPRQVPVKRALPKDSASSKPNHNIADLYMGKISDKSEYRKQMIETKDKWVSLELMDRKEARAELARQAIQSAEQATSQKREDTQSQQMYEAKKARIEQKHVATISRRAQTTALLSVLIQAGQSHSDMVEFLKLLP